MICKAMNFGALPLAGGLYDQHPKLIEEWEQIMVAENKEEQRRQAEQNRKNKQARMGRGSSGRRRR